MVDAPPSPTIPDAMTDGGLADGGLADGGPGDGSPTDALGPDARQPPHNPVIGSDDATIKSFYTCSTGTGGAALPIVLAILALRRRSFRGSGVT